MFNFSEPIKIKQKRKVIVESEDWRNEATVQEVETTIETNGVISRLTATEYRDFGIPLSTKTVKIFLLRSFSENEVSTGDIVSIVSQENTEYKVFSVSPAYSESVLPSFYNYNVTVLCERVS